VVQVHPWPAPYNGCTTVADGELLILRDWLDKRSGAEVPQHELLSSAAEAEEEDTDEDIFWFNEKKDAGLRIRVIGRADPALQMEPPKAVLVTDDEDGEDNEEDKVAHYVEYVEVLVRTMPLLEKVEVSNTRVPSGVEITIRASGDA
jgi:hypothetical protein